MKKQSNNNITRREFFQRLGMGTAAVAGFSLASCSDSEQKGSQSGSSQTGEIPKDKMAYRTNPKTNEKVSLLGYGCMRWPTKPAPTDEDPNADEIDQETVNKLIDFAIEHGVNYFDTSPAYCKGRSEKATGIALKRHPRDKYYIATKLSNFKESTWSREASMKMYHDSFKELQVDHIDYMLLHSVGGGKDSQATFRGRYIDNGMLDFLVAEREAGRIGNLGFSYHGNIAIFDMLLEQHDKYKWDFVQIQLNYLDWHYANELNESNTDAEYLYNELEKRHIPAIIMEPLLGGRLAALPDHIVNRLKQREPERSVASWAFRYAGHYPGVLTVLSGMTYMEHLEDNLRTFCPYKELEQSDIDFLHDTAGLIVEYPTIACNDCKYCMPCPYGIDIPGNFIHYNKCVNEGNVPESRQSENYRKARRAFLVGYDRSVPKLRQASHCIGCGHCVPECPQNIDIPKEMQRIDQFAEQLRQGTL